MVGIDLLRPHRCVQPFRQRVSFFIREAGHDQHGDGMQERLSGGRSGQPPAPGSFSRATFLTTSLRLG
ncbi:MAG: hypothetical protein P8Z40_14750 [Chloroflexota bacterium]